MHVSTLIKLYISRTPLTNCDTNQNIAMYNTTEIRWQSILPLKTIMLLNKHKPITV